MTFEKELEELINKHSKENASNTPDWVLGQYLAGCLAVFNLATQHREAFWGRNPALSEDKTTTVTTK